MRTRSRSFDILVKLKAAGSKGVHTWTTFVEKLEWAREVLSKGVSAERWREAVSVAAAGFPILDPILDDAHERMASSGAYDREKGDRLSAAAVRVNEAFAGRF